jgi:hypothetical protein
VWVLVQEQNLLSFGGLEARPFLGIQVSHGIKEFLTRDTDGRYSKNIIGQLGDGREMVGVSGPPREELPLVVVVPNFEVLVFLYFIDVLLRCWSQHI